MEHSRANSPAYDYTDCSFTHIFRRHQFIYLDIQSVPKCNSLNSAPAVCPTSQIETLAFTNKRINKSQMMHFERVQDRVGQVYLYSSIHISSSYEGHVCQKQISLSSIILFKKVTARKQDKHRKPLCS